jgi:NAD(P)H-flavin reductase
MPTSDRPAYFELAIQKSTNPPAQWLWKPESEILDEQIIVRTGGSFVWPPPGINIDEIEQVVLVAGGVGINPLISMFAHLMSLSKRPKKIRFVYGTRVEEGQIKASRILFLTRLMELVKKQGNGNVQLDLFLSATSQKDIDKATDLPEHVKLGRIGKDDLEAAIGKDRGVRQATLAYVCGPPAMTDQFVDFLSSRDGMDKRKVLCEKWW